MSLIDQTERSTISVAARAQRASLTTAARRVLDEAHCRHVPDSRWRAEPLVILLVTTTSLALVNFLSTAPVLSWLLSRDDRALPSEWTSAFWVGCRIVCYFFVPLLTLVALGRSPLERGLRMRGVARHVPLYFALAAVMLPIVVVFSFVPAFQRYYPFHDYAGQSLRGLLLWEALYALQFVTLEFFYRGFLLFSLERYLGVYAIFVMVIPYCMVHFGKPFAETLAAIPAGVILGALALRTRSIWPGAALHIAVGWTMDLLSLWHRGSLIRLWNEI